jgi:hypothetical protein
VNVANRSPGVTVQCAAAVHEVRRRFVSVSVPAPHLITVAAEHAALDRARRSPIGGPW